MNDIILSGLLNLFALFGSGNGLDKEKSLELIRDYLTRFWGIRNIKSYARLYTDLREYYDDFPEMDKAPIIEGICGNLKSKLPSDQRATLLLRFMEFCSKNGEGINAGDLMFRKVADIFDIGADTFDDLVRFTEGKEGGNVLLTDFGDNYGKIKTILIRDRSDFLAVSYLGSRSIFMNDIMMMDNVFQIWQQSSVIKCNHFAPIYFSSIMERYLGDSKTGIVELCGRDINFRFKQGGDNGMHNLSFSLKSGELVAIMGGSGVGKSTLLSLLNGNLRPQSGSITINGHDISEESAKALIGFVPQDDLLIEELTVYQNLFYTAKLCFEGMSEEELDARTMSVLAQLGLDAAKDLKVGSPINKFISGGQRKRLNIALELIREPAILYLDEPTSGLSSTDTEKVILLLKEQTQKGKLIVVNIHQPSSDVYKLFDRLWLLDKGGYPVFDGNPIEAISYFKGAANYADFRTSTCPVCGNVNPEIILNIIDEKAYDSSGQLTEQRKVTPAEWHDMYLRSRPESDGVKVSDVPPTDQKRPGKFKQMLIFLSRNFTTKKTNLQYILVTLLEAPVLAAICAILTHYTPDSGVYTVMDNKNLVSYFFMAIIVSIFLGMSGSAEEIIKDRALLKREKFLRLSYGSYIWSKVLYMAGVCLIQTLLFIIVGNLIMGIHTLFWTWWLILFISAFLSSLIGLLLSQCMNSVVAIYISIPLLLIPQILLCGLVVKFEDLNSRSGTGNVPIIGDVIPSRWAYEALAVTSFTSNDYEAQFYSQDRAKFQDMFYLHAYLHELESRAETLKDYLDKGKDPQKHLSVLKTGFPAIETICDMPPYHGGWDYDSIIGYIEQAKDIVSKRGNKTTLALDREICRYIKEHSKEELLDLKKSNYNLQLENLVLNRNTEHVYSVIGSHIVPRSGYIFLKPSSKIGRAPFYSGVKVVGNTEIPTLWFNMAIMLMMCILVGACLFADFPGKYVREEHN